MKIFAIRDESEQNQKDLAYLLYYEKEKKFYIELPEDADSWETPILLSSFLRAGERTVNSYWSRLWVEQRIVPSGRQNIGQVLRENGLRQYDEFDLLMLDSGRCTQDSYYLASLSETALPDEIVMRFQRKIEDIIPLDDFQLLVFFRDGVVRKCPLRERFAASREFSILVRKPDLFQSASILPGGYGVAWDVKLVISDTDLYESGDCIPLSISDFCSFIQQRAVNSMEAAQILGCTRQNIRDLTRRGKLHPIKLSDKSTLYLKSEILRRNWE